MRCLRRAIEWRKARCDSQSRYTTRRSERRPSYRAKARRASRAPTPRGHRMSEHQTRAGIGSIEQRFEGLSPAPLHPPRREVMRASILRRLAPAVALLLLMTATRAAGAQGAPARPATDSLALRADGIAAILLGEIVLATERGGDSASAARTTRAAAAVARAYRAAGRTPAITDELLARAISNHLAGVPSAASAGALQRVDEQLFRLLLLQAAQGARLVEQNDRIIELLQALAARR